MNFLKRSPNNRKVIAILAIMIGLTVAKSQPTMILDTGIFIPLSSYIDNKTNEFAYWDDLYDASYIFYGKIRIINNAVDTLIICPDLFQYKFSKSDIGLFWPHNASRQFLYSKYTCDFFQDLKFIKIPPYSVDTVTIYLYGGFSDYFVSLIKDFKKFPAGYENFLRMHRHYEKLIHKKCKLWLFDPRSGPTIAVDIKAIKIVTRYDERRKYIDLLYDSYIKPNMIVIE